MRIVLGTIEEGKLVNRVLVPEHKIENPRKMLTEAYTKADEVFGKEMWHVRRQKSLLFGGYIVSDNPCSKGDTLIIE